MMRRRRIQISTAKTRIKNVSFDEKEFARMMREMMGMPSEEQDEVVNRPFGDCYLAAQQRPE
jgi:hypothetical protein